MGQGSGSKMSHSGRMYTRTKQEVWPPGSAVTVWPRRSLMTQTQVQHGSDWSRDLATLTFDLRGHGACSWCGSSSFVRRPSWNFVGFAIQKIWCTMCVSINGPGDLDLWPFDLETGMRVASKVGNLPFKFGHARPLGSGIIRYVRDGRTDRQTDGQKQRLLSPFLRAGT